MASKAPRIHSSIWEQYKDEIVALYRRGTLPKTMKTMEERHGFKASKNQYTAKIKDWGLEKYGNSTMWKHIGQKKEKRKLEGKDSLFEIRGRKRSRSYIERELSRNVTFTSQVQLLEDIPTPEGVRVFTPDAESSSIALRQVYTGNLPWLEFQRDVGIMMMQIWGNQTPRLRPEHELLRRKHSTAELSEIAVALINSHKDMIDPNTGSSSVLSTWPVFKRPFFQKRFPPSDADEPFSSAFDFNKTIYRSNTMLIFIHYFVYTTNNGILFDRDIEKGFKFLSSTFGSTFLLHLLDLKSVPMKIFMRKIFPLIVDSGNISVVKAVIDSEIDMSRYRHFSSPGYPGMRDNCLWIAVCNADQEMVELLCKEGFPMRLTNWPPEKLPWNSGNLDILRTLLQFGADPECLVEGEGRGFPLVSATVSGKLEAVDMLLAKGANVNSYVPSYYGTALQAAVYSKNSELAELLIERGADVNVPRRAQVTRRFFWEKGMPQATPLEIAVETNNFPLFQALITLDPHLGICVTPLDDSLDDSLGYPPDYCPLHRAVKNRNRAIVSVLLSRGANINCRGHLGSGSTPLQIAARLNYPEMVSFLLQHGADVNSAPAALDGRTAIQAAAENGSIGILRMILARNADVNAPAGYEYGRTALQAAISSQHPLMAGVLYAAGADLNAPPGHCEGLTAIQAAAMNGDLHLLSDLIDWGAEINGPTAKECGFTVMEAATLSGNKSILELLVKNGVDINASSSDIEKSRCLAMAALNQWMNGARYLLKIGANLDGYWDSDEYCLSFNALGWSIFHDDIDMVDLLLDNGADLYSPVSDDYGKQYALSVGLTTWYNTDIIRSLLSRCDDLEKVCRNEDVLACAINDTAENSQIFKMVFNAIKGLPKDVYDNQLQKAWDELPTQLYCEGESLDQEFMELLLETGVDFNSRDDSSKTALHRALERGFTHSFKYLVEKGAEVNSPANGKIGTLLQEAIRKEDLEIASFLLEKGADINAAPAEIRGITALQAASINGLFDLAIELLRRGASVAAPAASEEGRTAINGAAERGQQDMIQLLLNHYDGDEDIAMVRVIASTYADKEGHVEIAEWLRQNPLDCMWN